MLVYSTNAQNSSLEQRCKKSMNKQSSLMTLFNFIEEE